MITKVNQFVNELNIAIEDCTNGRVKAFIDKYEPIIVRKVVGDKLYNEIQAASEPYTGEMAVLLNGGTYTVEGVDYHFRGLKWITAGFIYYWYQRNNAYSVAQTGGQSPNFEVATARSMNFKMVSAWNQATELIGLNSCDTGTLKHFLTNSDFEHYCISNYEGGKIKGQGWW
jgi:hypothetical protein